MPPKPHVSPALARLRYCVAAMAILVGAAVSVQLLVFGFVHFTTVRWEVVQSQSTQPLTVVRPQGSQPAETAPPGATGPETTSAGGTTSPRRVKTLAELEAERNVRSLTQWDHVLREFSNVAVTIGVVGALSLALLVFMGVCVAGGAAVPGVERVVTASVWAFLLCFVTLPLRDLMPTVPFGGVLSNYEEVVASSEAVSADQGSTTMLLVSHLVLPLAALGIALMVAARFWGGVAKGIIVTSVNELDALLEREMETIRAKGIGSNFGPRTVGTLNAAVGEAPAAPPPEEQPARPRSRPLGRPDDGEWRRPI
jgi:hypothetical protein